MKSKELKEEKLKNVKSLSELNVGFWIHEKALVRTELGWKTPDKITKKEMLMVSKEVDGKSILSLVLPKSYYKIPYNGELLGVKLFSDSTQNVECKLVETDDTGKSKKRKAKITIDGYCGNIMFKPSDKIIGEGLFEVKNMISKRKFKSKKIKYDGFLYGFDVSPVVSFEYDSNENPIDYCIVKSK